MVKVDLICHGEMQVVASQKGSVVLSGTFKLATKGMVYTLLRNMEPDPVKLKQFLKDFMDSINCTKPGELF